jgi:hypothetical protein
LKLACTKCGRGPVTCLLPSPDGAYVRCRHCHHIWQEERLIVSWRSPSEAAPQRRRTDRTAEAQERLIRLLIDRCAHLEAENDRLRQSARAFGELAERLNRHVRGQRHTGRDRSRDSDG